MRFSFPDLIDAVDGWIGRLSHGSMHRFTVSTQGDFTGMEVELMLRQYGMRIWGREFDQADEFAFLVKRSQAVWAEYILCRAGVPLTSPLLDARNAAYRRETMPQPWTKQGIGPHTFVDHVVDWLNRLLG
jgi:hypothetical protein